MVYVDAAGERRTFSGEDFPVPASTSDEIARLTELLDEMSRTMDPDAPWAMPGAEALDAQPLSAWLAEHSDDQEASELVGLFVGAAMLGKPTNTFSVLQALYMASSAGGFAHLADADFILDRRVVGGLQSVPLRLAERAVALGVDLRLGARWSGSLGHRDDRPRGRTRPRRNGSWPSRPRRGPPDRLRAGPSAGAPAVAAAPVVRAGDQGARHVSDAVLAGGRPLGHRVQPLPDGARGVRQHQPSGRAGDPRRFRERSAGRRDPRARSGRAPRAGPGLVVRVLRRTSPAAGLLRRERLVRRRVDRGRVREQFRPGRHGPLRTGGPPACGPDALRQQ